MNLASDDNAKRILAQLKEYDKSYREVLQKMEMMEKTIQTLNLKLDQQMKLYTDFFVKQYGSGPTERSEKW